MAVAVFDYSQFTALFPELTNGGVTEPVASSLFAVAGLLLDNTDCSPVQDVSARLIYLNYIVAHLASIAGYPLAAGATTPAPSGVIGRISSATEGSVSVSADYGQVSGNQAYWLQSQYGALYWQLTAPFRTMNYRAVPPRYFGPAYGVPGRFR